MDLSAQGTDPEETVVVKEHKRTRKKKSVRDDLYALLPIRDIKCDVPESERFCPDCDAPMEHLGYKTVREELRITPAKVERVRYLQETLVCPVCREGDDTTIRATKTPAALLAHSPASPDMVAMVMYQKSCLYLPFYRQEKDWSQKGVPLPRYSRAHWYNYCALEYLAPVYEALHQKLLDREVIHADEVPCQVLHEEGKDLAWYLKILYVDLSEWKRWASGDRALRLRTRQRRGKPDRIPVRIQRAAAL